MTVESLKRWQTLAWGAAPFEPLAQASAEIHDALVSRLVPRRGERWLDVATGTGAIARRAARAGADVVGIDIAPGMIASAVSLATAEGLAVRFQVGDAEQLPFADARFDVVASAQGVMFALDHQAVARELARVCRPGGRLGLSTLTAAPENAEFLELWQVFVPASVRATVADPLDWGRTTYVRRLLGDAFELEFAVGDAPLHADSGDELWRLHAASCGPIRMLAASLPPGKRAALRARFVAYYEAFRAGGQISVPREYLVVIGTRRSPGRDGRA